MIKTPVKFQKDWSKTVGVALTRYLLQTWNHAPRITHHGKPNTMSPRFSSKRQATKSRDRRDSRADKREGQGRKTKINESEETIPLYPYLLQG